MVAYFVIIAIVNLLKALSLETTSSDCFYNDLFMSSYYLWVLANMNQISRDNLTQEWLPHQQEHDMR